MSDREKLDEALRKLDRALIWGRALYRAIDGSKFDWAVARECIALDPWLLWYEEKNHD